MDYLRRYDIDSATARKDIRSFTETLEKNGILERWMMEKRKRYRIADAEIEIAFTENYTEIICRDYEVKAEGKPDFVIEVTDEEVEREKKKSEPGASKGIIESLAIYRKLLLKYLVNVDETCYFIYFIIINV